MLAHTCTRMYLSRLAVNSEGSPPEIKKAKQRVKDPEEKCLHQTTDEKSDKPSYRKKVTLYVYVCTCSSNRSNFELYV